MLRIHPGLGAALTFPWLATTEPAGILPSFCDPDWTALNGGICTNAEGNYMKPDGTLVTEAEWRATLAPLPGQQPAAPPAPRVAGIDAKTLGWLVAGAFIFALVFKK